MTDLERLKARRQAWMNAVGPTWILRHRPRIIAQLDDQIERLEKRLAEGFLP
jgi:chaperonin cofactor prefoldin